MLVDDIPSRAVIDILFAHLMRYDPAMNRYHAELAEAVKVSKDQREYRFTLRKSAAWDDQTPITTEDAEFTFNTIMSDKTDSASTRVLFQGFGFEKISPLEFKIKVNQPNVNTLSSILNHFILIQKKQFEKVSDFNTSAETLKPVTSGPYRLKSVIRDQKIELERKKNGWVFSLPEYQNRYRFESIVYRIIPDPSLAYERWIKGEIDLLEMNAETYAMKAHGIDREKVGTDAGSGKRLWAKHFITQAPATYGFLGWNLKRPQFESKKTRQALARLIPYEEIIRKVYHGEASRCVSPFGSNTANTAADQKNHAFHFDPSLGLKGLNEDGWNDAGQTGVLTKTVNGKPFPFELTLLYNLESPPRAKVAQIIQEQFKRAGIRVKIEALEYNAMMERLNHHDFDAVLMGWGKGNLHAESKQYWHSTSADGGGSNFGSYSNPAADRLIEKASSELNPEIHDQLNQKLARIIYDDQPYAFLTEMQGFMAGFNRDRIKSRIWARPYDSSPPISIYGDK